MATGRIRRTARRGVAAATLVWLAAAAASILLASSASAAPAATVDIRNFTPPVVSVDRGGQVTFVNRIPAQNKTGIAVPLVGSVSATVHTDVAVTFFGQKRALKSGESAAWKFPDPATNGSITYTYRVVPQAGLAAAVANQVINTVTSQLPALPAPVPYVVQTIAPNVPNLPSVNVPQLPTLPALPALPEVNAPAPGDPPVPVPPPPGGNPAAPPADSPVIGASGSPYQYGSVTGAPRMSASAAAAAAAFDPDRFFLPGQTLGTVDRGGSSGSGGMAGSYDGASVPVFGQLAGLDGTSLDEESATENAASNTPAGQTLPAAALAAIVALAAVTAALVRTQQAQRSSR